MAFNDDLSNNTTENTENSLNEEKEKSNEEANTSEEFMDELETKEELSEKPLNKKKKTPQEFLKEAKEKGDLPKLIGVGIAIVVVLFILFSGGDEPKKKTSGDSKFTTELSKNQVDDIELREKKITGALRDTNLYSAVEKLRKDQEQMYKMVASMKKGQGGGDGLFKGLVAFAKENNSKLSYSLMNGGKLENSYTVEGANTILTSNTNVSKTINEVVAIFLSKAYILKSISDDRVYIALTNRDNKVFNLFLISSENGKQLINNETIIKEIDFIINSKNTSAYTLTRVEKQVVLFNKEGEISNLYEVSESETAVKAFIKSSKDARAIMGYMDGEFNKYTLMDDGNLYKNGVIFDQNVKLYYTTQKNVLGKLIGQVVYIKNDKIKSILKAPNIKIVFLKKYKTEKVEYVFKDDFIYTVKTDFTLNKIGKGFIGAYLNDDGLISITNIKLLSKVKQNIIKVSKFGAFKIMGAKATYVVSEGNLINFDTQEIIGKEDELFLDKNNNLVDKNGNLIDKIRQLQKLSKVGLTITTLNHVVKLRSKENQKLFNNKGAELFSDKKYEKTFSLDRENNTITLHIKEKVDLDEEKKLIKGIPYKKMVQEGKKTVFYNAFGEAIADVDLTTKKIFTEKIKSLKIEKGDLFDYVYVIGKKAELYNSDLGGIKSKGLSEASLSKTFGEQDNIEDIILSDKNKDTYNNREILIEELFKKGIPLNKINIMTDDGYTLNFITSNYVSINSKKIKYETALLNLKDNVISINIDNRKNRQALRELNLAKNLENLVFNIKKFDMPYSQYYSDNMFVFKYVNYDVVLVIDPLKDEKNYYKIYDKFIDVRTGALTLKLSNNKNIKIDLASISNATSTMLNDLVAEYKVYLDNLKKNENVVKVSQTDILEKEIQNKKKKIKKLESYIRKILTKEDTPIIKSLTEKQIETIVEAEKDADFTFEVATKMRFKVKSLIEIVEGTDGYSIAELKTFSYTDLEGKKLTLLKPILITKNIGDFVSGKVYVKPYKLIFIDPDTGLKNQIDIPESATIMSYKDPASGYYLDAVPAFVIRKELRSLGTKITLATISGILDALTTKDTTSSMLESVTGNDTTTTADKSQEALQKGASEGIKELLDVIEKQADSLKDVLITDPGLDITVKFLEEVKVTLKEAEIEQH